jgi:hypothetical protein
MKHLRRLLIAIAIACIPALVFGSGPWEPPVDGGENPKAGGCMTCSVDWTEGPIGQCSPAAELEPSWANCTGGTDCWYMPGYGTECMPHCGTSRCAWI